MREPRSRDPDSASDNDNDWPPRSRNPLPPDSSSYPPSSSWSYPPSMSSYSAYASYADRSSYPPSSSSCLSAEAAHQTKSPDKDYPPNVSRDSSRTGLLPAMILPPLILIVAVVALCVFLKRRRRRRSSQSTSNGGVGGGGTPSTMEMAQTSNNHNTDIREYRTSSPPPRVNFTTSNPPPIIISDRNDNYLTGLDTSSQGSRSRPVSYADIDADAGADADGEGDIRRSWGGTTFLDPPPPYKASGHDPPIAYEYAIREGREGSGSSGAVGIGRSPFEDPVDGRGYDDEGEEVDDEMLGVADGMRPGRNPFEDPEDVEDVHGRRWSGEGRMSSGRGL